MAAQTESNEYEPNISYPPQSHPYHIPTQSRQAARTHPSTTRAALGEPISGGSQRRRIQVACARCRKRKIRCSGDTVDGQGCDACRNAGVSSTCLFERSKLGTRPADTIEQLQMLNISVPASKSAMLQTLAAPNANDLELDQGYSLYRSPIPVIGNRMPAPAPYGSNDFSQVDNTSANALSTFVPGSPDARYGRPSLVSSTAVAYVPSISPYTSMNGQFNSSFCSPDSVYPSRSAEGLPSAYIAASRRGQSSISMQLPPQSSPRRHMATPYTQFDPSIVTADGPFAYALAGVPATGSYSIPGSHFISQRSMSGSTHGSNASPGGKRSVATAAGPSNLVRANTQSRRDTTLPACKYSLPTGSSTELSSASADKTISENPRFTRRQILASPAASSRSHRQSKPPMELGEPKPSQRAASSRQRHVVDGINGIDQFERQPHEGSLGTTVENAPTNMNLVRSRDRSHTTRRGRLACDHSHIPGTSRFPVDT